MLRKAEAENVVDRLVDLGAELPGTRRQAVDEVHEIIKPDYIPGGGNAKEATNLRPAPPGHRCGLITGDDMQSGPFYCGDPASLIADSNDNSIVATCKRHERILRELERESHANSNAKG